MAPFKNVFRQTFKFYKDLRHLLDFHLALFLVATELLQVLPDWSDYMTDYVSLNQFPSFYQTKVQLKISKNDIFESES